VALLGASGPTPISFCPREAIGKAKNRRSIAVAIGGHDFSQFATPSVRLIRNENQFAVLLVPIGDDKRYIQM
jgi:hypothetical protein